jgi:hypothetical protein
MHPRENLMMRPLIALITDFGTKDHYVGVMKGVMKHYCPDAEFIDITHNIPPQDVRAAAYTIAMNYKYFPQGTTFLVIVDPGVGTQRTPIAVATDHYTFVAPDNGVLSYMLAQEHLQIAVGLAAYPIGHLSNTFHGRDIFAPAAAMAARGDKLYQLGEVIYDALNLYPIPRMKVDAGVIDGEVLYIDHFGNIVTSIGDCMWVSEETLELQPRFFPELDMLKFSTISKVTIGDITLGQIHRTYSDVPRGDLLALIGSNGFLELATNQGNAAKRLEVKMGDPVKLIAVQERK